MSTEVRQPAVAGRFYPSNPQRLLADIASYAPRENDATEKLQALGCIVPHAGYMYSGAVAAAVYDRLALPRRYIILCPNHTGLGHPLAIMRAGEWHTPLGNVRVDTGLADEFMATFPELAENSDAHRNEHALEVQLPFLQSLIPDFQFVPIVIGTGNLETLLGLGEAMAQVISRSAEKVLIVASSDMNHYEDDDTTRTKDRAAIDRILALDPEGLFKTIHQQRISMCGYGPAIAMLAATLRLGASEAELVKYATSADVSGDKSYCVGYAGIAVM